MALAAAIADAAGTELRNFVGGLNPDILSLSSLWGCMPWARYNWFAGAQKDVRAYRNTKRDALKTKQITALEEHWGNTARSNYARAIERANQAAALAK